MINGKTSAEQAAPPRLVSVVPTSMEGPSDSHNRLKTDPSCESAGHEADTAISGYLLRFSS